jgi:AraC-like DNA-binding protein/quercetin dioxygenase-like cupin family protein
MARKNSQLTKSPTRQKARHRLQETGLAAEYFPAFEQRQHDFHTHGFVEILFVISGTFRHVTADRTYDETSGGLTILNYNQFHTLTTPNGPVELINVYWDLRKRPVPALPEPLAGQMAELIPAHPMLEHRLNRVRHLQVEQKDKTQQLLFALLQEQQAPDPGSEAAIDALFRLFLIELCRAAPAKIDANETARHPRMEAVRRHLEQNFSEPVRLEQLCRLSRLRKTNLCRQFKMYTGLSTGEYLKQLRLAAALQKLRATNDKVLNICYDCGFSDISNFNRTFRKAFGQSPGQYRAANKR